jgi:5-methylcytosine-specific restriction protein A
MSLVNWLLTRAGIRPAPLADHSPAGSAPRSPHWPACRKAHLAAHPTCAACGGTTHLQVHHKKPFHLHPELELDPANLITLCESPGVDHHLHVGHLGDWKGFNPNVDRDASRELARHKGAA